MKERKILSVAVCVLLVASFSLHAQSKTGKMQEKARMVKECIEAGNYEIEVNTALPLGGQSIQLPPYYSLRVCNDSVYSCLPYYGRAYMLPYGGGEGLDFEAGLVDYKRRTGRKKNYEITFSARTQEDYYTFHVTVYDNGSSGINVNMQKKQSMDFIGRMIFKEEDNEEE